MSPEKIKLSSFELELKHATQVPPVKHGDLIVCLHNIRSMHNVGSAFRSADAFAASKMLLTGYTPHPPRIEISKTALGADEWVPWEHATDGVATLMQYKEKGWKLVAVEQTSRSESIVTGLPNPANDRLILIFGNEVLGLDDDVIAVSDYVVDIPQYGRKHSLNVSVSVGIALFAVHVRAR